MAFLVALKSNPTGKFESHQHSNFNNRSFETKQKKSNLRSFFAKQEAQNVSIMAVWRQLKMT